MLRTLAMILLATSLGHAQAEPAPINFNYKDGELVKMIEDYAKASGQKFIIDPAVRGKATLINHEPVSTTEAFNQLSSALAINGVAISKQDDVMLVGQARNIQRNLIDSGSTLPPLRPEKMFMLVINLKYASADEINKQLRILASKDGELSPVLRTNQIIVTDWVSNLYRITKLLKEIDVKVEKKKAL